MDKNIDEITKVYPTSKEELLLSMIDGTIYFKGFVKRVFETSFYD